MMIQINKTVFDDIYKLNECKDIELLEYFRQIKPKLNDIKLKADNMINLYNFFCTKGWIFETDDRGDAMYTTFIDSLIDKVRKGIPNFDLNDLRSK